MKGFILGILAAVVFCALTAFVGVKTGTLIPANADAKPGALETWAAKTSLNASIKREAPATADPVALNDQNLTQGVKLYGENCAVCHGVSNGRPSTIAFGLYQKAPQLAKHGVEDDPAGETYWKIKHGIRMTGMPAFTATLDDTQIWQLALFLKHMDSLPPGPQKVWKAQKNPGLLVPKEKLPSPPPRK